MEFNISGWRKEAWNKWSWIYVQQQFHQTELWHHNPAVASWETSPPKKLPHFSISVSERQIFLRSSGKAAAHSWVFETNEYFTVSLSLFLNRAASISDVSQSALYIYLSEYSEGFEFSYQLIEQFKMYYQKKSLVQKPWRRGSVWQAIKADLNAISPSSDYTARQ